MDVLSKDFKRAMLESMDRAWEKKLELEKEYLATKDFLTQKEVLKEFSLTAVTLGEWEKNGLKRLMPRYEGRKKFTIAKLTSLIFCQSNNTQIVRQGVG
ncbi:hypothetical protein Hs30E_15650 [Lactococcus hodotermopsidis]|uniref:HTH merR-type domain-containing protein n=1 Tax=Pseudolactococcus hodotermopsidis TaxID=2709157 RepID=A0A6A0BEZ0_9LACT|nr:hypothetical protein [Lactococcus hodotermopsidis]GFH43014.1 hypothetical protein Hs30E_15650 [Lactococcus hodotermopsidis]